MNYYNTNYFSAIFTSQDMIQDQHNFIMVTELCDYNLKVYMASGTFQQGCLQMAKRMCYELLSGLHALHSNNIVHGNIKVDSNLQ